MLYSPAKYRPSFKGPTICRNCSMFGHGTQHCHRKPSCSLCASSDHNQSICPLKILGKDTIPVFKCPYCTRNNFQPVNHRASDPSCPGRKAYADSRKQVISRQQKTKATEASKCHQTNNKVYMDAPLPAALTHTFSSVVSKKITQRIPEPANPTPATDNTDENLFSTAELFQIFTNTIGEIRKCKTKLDQIQIIANLISYVI